MIRLVLLAALCMLGTASQAAMQIDRAVVTFSSEGSAREDIRVSNPDSEPLFVDVQVLEVSRPGTGVEERTVVKDPERIGLIATPRRLMVPPGSQRVVRLVNLEGHGDTERVYRINLRPVSGPLESEQMGVRVMVGYQLLVFVEPAEVRVDLEAEREGKKLTLFNAGNVNVRVHHGKQCPPAPSQGDCEEVAGARLYPGNTVVIDLPRDAPVEFSVAASGEATRRRFP